MKLWSILFVLLISCHPLFATSYGPAQNREVLSQNKKFLLLVNAGSSTHTVYEANKRDRALWSFNCDVWHFPFLIANDGKSAATVSWRHIQDKTGAENKALKDKTAVQFWRDGKAWKSIKFSEFFPNPPKTQDVGIGPIGGFWRTWYSDIAVTTEGFSILLTNKKIISFSFTSGTISKNPDIKLFPVQKQNILQVKYPPHDQDKDGMRDIHEVRYGLDTKLDDSKMDKDKDGFSNIDEYKESYNLADPKEHPPVINRCSVIAYMKNSVIILNHLTGEKITMELNKDIFLKDKLNQPYKFRMTEINKDHIVVICWGEDSKIKVSGKPRLKTPDQ